MFTVFSGFDVFVLIILSLICVAADTRLFFALLWIIYAAFGWWFNDWSPKTLFPWMMNHFGDILMYTVVYLIIGGAWSAFKWWLFSRQSARNLYSRFNSTVYTGSEKAPTWQEYYTERKEKVYNNKARLTDWVGFWWYSMIETFIGDWLFKLKDAVYHILYNVYEQISNSAYENVSKK